MARSSWFRTTIRITVDSARSLCFRLLEAYVLERHSGETVESGRSRERPGRSPGRSRESPRCSPGCCRLSTSIPDACESVPDAFESVRKSARCICFGTSLREVLPLRCISHRSFCFILTDGEQLTRWNPMYFCELDCQTVRCDEIVQIISEVSLWTVLAQLGLRANVECRCRLGGTSLLAGAQHAQSLSGTKPDPESRGRAYLAQQKSRGAAPTTFRWLFAPSKPCAQRSASQGAPALRISWW